MKITKNSSSATFGWFLCSLAALFYCYEYLLRIAPGVMSNELMQYYALNATSFGNLFAVYYYIYTPMQIPVGLMLDKYGCRFLLTLASLICAIGTFVFACSQHLLVAQIGRFMVGFGSAFAFVGVLKIASVWLKPARFGMIAGLTTSLGMVGGMFGNNVIALLVKEIGWQATMYGSGLFGLILSVMIWVFVRNHRPNYTPANAPNNTELSIKDLFYNMFVLLKKPQMWLIAFIGAVLYTSLSVFAELWGAPYFEQAKGFSPQIAAALTSTVFLGWAVGGPIIGFLSDYWNDRRMPLILGSISAALSISAIIYIEGLGPITLSVLLFLFGVFSSAENITFVIAKESAPPSLAGSAIALTNMFVMLAGSILQPFVGYILDLYWEGRIVNGIHLYNNASFQNALLFLPITFFISGGLSIFLRKSYSAVDESTQTDKDLITTEPLRLSEKI